MMAMDSEVRRVLTIARTGTAVETRRYGEMRTAHDRGPGGLAALDQVLRIPTGLPALDRTLGGGFRSAAVHELLAPVDGAAVRTVALLTARSALCYRLEAGTAGTNRLEADTTTVASGLRAGRGATNGLPGAKYNFALPGSRLEAGATTDNRLEADTTGPEIGPETRAAALWLIYVDSGGDFCPMAAARLGVPLERVIVLRPRSDLDVLWVCEQALRCPGVVLVASPRRVDAYASRRLQLAAESGGTLGLILREDGRGGHTFAESRVKFEPVAPVAERRVSPFPPPRLMRVEVMKLRGARLPPPFFLELQEPSWLESPDERRARDAGFEQRLGRLSRSGWPLNTGERDSPPGTEPDRAACFMPVHAVAAG